jgi:hypothetical protein
MSFGFKNLIKVVGKNFFNLSDEDVADMIDAYLSGGDSKFEYEALPEFMIIANISERLEKIRELIESIDRNCRHAGVFDGLASLKAREKLTIFSQALRKGRDLPQE